MFNEQNEIMGDIIEDIEREEDRCTDCGYETGHLTRHADGRNLCDECEDYDWSQERGR